MMKCSKLKRIMISKIKKYMATSKPYIHNGTMKLNSKDHNKQKNAK